MPSLVAAAASSDVDQSLLVILVFLLVLTIGLVLATYLEPGTQAKRLRVSQHLARLLAPRSQRHG